VSFRYDVLVVTELEVRSELLDMRLTLSCLRGGGQETIGLTIVPFFVHHGMVFVPLGYADPKITSLDEVHGASPYGAGTFAGSDGKRQPSELELAICETQGKIFATTAAKLVVK
jgi:NAD(P)H dehydrogenase (quinone)